MGSFDYSVGAALDFDLCPGNEELMSLGELTQAELIIHCLFHSPFSSA